MKKTEEIIGFPVIDISSGEKLGRVKDFIFNPDNGAADYLVVEGDDGGLMAKVVSAKDILGIGEYAVTIGSEASMKELNSNVDAVRLLKKDIKVKNIGILTKKGTMIGKTGDVYIDEEDNCKITGLEFIPAEPRGADGSGKILPSDLVITYGRDLIIVEADAEDKLTDKAAKTSGAVSQGISAESYSPSAYDAFVDKAVEAEREDKEEITVNAAEKEGNRADSMQSESAAGLFEQRQRQYLIGRRATLTISDDAGRTIVEEGMIINNEIIDEAKRCGKLVQLIMNNRE